ncbi:phosphocholine cytidylyltransferase family protein [Pontiella sulfatireligans]|uniref:Bifunctional IPC transferase and DIPP synthase n=1 Tax=Pontiella sulfatireligans TaxID=2750658 RepID=A0A6C2UPS9_9BACT|nr:phosphocholine cytidylyltransferase family protein [Pontiella sulfatireligans]VGO21281.1 Bifunctional IPC transferase and DIPP synthase [Pontiella sulfatireligans]
MFAVPPAVSLTASKPIRKFIAKTLSNEGSPVKTALLLAAGMGNRLAPLTDATPKCLVEVNGIPILERLIRSLRSHGITRLFVVTGHLSEVIEDYLGRRYAGIEIIYIASPLYKTTNNIYSLWLAGKEIDEPFMLIESDLVFQTELLAPMLQPDRIAVSKMLPWMNGTTVTLNGPKQLKAFCLGAESRNCASHYKTVNIYNFSRNTWKLIQKRLDQYISDGKVNGYYEAVFAEMVAEGTISLAPVFFDAARWYEIDTPEDLSAAERMFPEPSRIRVAMGEKLHPLRKAISSRPKGAQKIDGLPVPA